MAVPQRFYKALITLVLISFCQITVGETRQCDAPPQLAETPSDTATQADRSERVAFAEGQPITAIRFHQLPLFDTRLPDENRQIHRIANALHRNTRRSTLLKQLKLQAGAPFSAEVTAEAERRLRQNVYISRVQITPKYNCAGELIVWVITQDSWAITPGFNYSQIDDETTVDLSLTHSNFFGLGHRLSMGYTKREEEDSVSANYYAPRLFSPGIDLRFGVTRGDWIDAQHASLEKPFLTYNTTFAYGVSHQSRHFERNIYLRGASFYKYDYEVDRINVYWGVSQGVQNHRVGRWRVGLTQNRLSFETLASVNPNTVDIAVTSDINDRHRHMAWIAYNSFSTHFAKRTNIRNIKRLEDIPKGVIWRLSLGYGEDEIDEGEFINTQAGLRLSPLFTKKHILQTGINISADWKRETEEIENGFSTLDLNYFWLLRPNHRIVFEAIGIHGKNLTLDRLLTQGGAMGLRGYPSLYQLGNNFYRTTTEYRYYFQRELLNIFQFATALYVDAGQARFSEEIEGLQNNADYDETLWNIGFGLRIASNRIGFGSIAHINIAKPMTDLPVLSPSNPREVGEPFDNVRFTVVLKSRF